MERLHDDLHDAISFCWTCRTECEKSLYGFGLAGGSRNLDPDHVRIMADCMQVCQAAADSMVRQSPVSSMIAAACAQICDACADSCENMDSETMRHLSVICRQCASACRDAAAQETKRPPQSFAGDVGTIRPDRH